MVTCPKCGCGDCTKDGIIKERHHYKCKTCGYRHTVQHVGKSSELKRQALELYFEGLGFRFIGRFLKCSHVAVYNWIKAFGKAADDIRSEKAIEVVGVDEMQSYISSKKNTVGSGLLLIDMESGSSTAYWAIVEQPPASNCGIPSKISGLAK